MKNRLHISPGLRKYKDYTGVDDETGGSGNELDGSCGLREV